MDAFKSTMELPPSDYVFYIQTMKASSFRILVEALKEILMEARIEIDREGIKLIAVDPAHSILVNMKLHADKFETFLCNEYAVVNVKMNNFAKLIKTCSNEDILVLYMEKRDYNSLGIHIFNSDKKMTTRYIMQLADLDIESADINDMEFANSLTMSSSDFQKVIRDMSTFNTSAARLNVVEIISSANQLAFLCEGEFAKQETVFTIGSSLKPAASDGSDIIQGKFPHKNLVLLTKCTPLCKDITIYFKNDFPIIFEYDVAGLGEVKMAISQILQKSSTL